MTSSRRDFQSAFDVLLAFDLREIHVVFMMRVEQRREIHFGRRDFDLPFQEIAGSLDLIEGHVLFDHGLNPVTNNDHHVAVLYHVGLIADAPVAGNHVRADSLVDERSWRNG